MFLECNKINLQNRSNFKAYYNVKEFHSPDSNVEIQHNYRSPCFTAWAHSEQRSRMTSLPLRAGSPGAEVPAAVALFQPARGRMGSTGVTRLAGSHWDRSAKRRAADAAREPAAPGGASRRV